MSPSTVCMQLARTIALAADQQPRREGDAGPHGLWEASGSEGNKEPEGGGPGEGSEGGRARQHTRRRRDLDGGRRAQRKGRPVAGEAARVYAAGLAGLRPMVDRLALFHPEEVCTEPGEGFFITRLLQTCINFATKFAPL